MHAAAQTFAVALFSVAAAAALGVGLAEGLSVPVTEVVKLERVEVVGQRADVAVVARLPRVVIEQRRSVPREVTLAQAQAAVWIA